MIKMGINKNEESKCEECGVTWGYTSCMYNLMIKDQKFVLCRQCSQTLFQKLLKAECMQNSKIKTKEDMDRINKERMRSYKNL